MSITKPPASRVHQVFTAASENKNRRTKNKATAPFSLRLTDEERVRLNAQSGGRPLGKFIRSQLLGEHATPRREIRRPALNDTKIAQALAGLGQSRLAANMNQIAKAANIGVIDSSPVLINDLDAACRHIREMRDALIEALGLKAEGET